MCRFQDIPQTVQQTPLWISLAAPFFGGVFGALIGPYVTDLIDTKKRNATRARRILDQVQDAIADITHNKKKFEIAFFYKSEKRLEAMGYSEVAKNIFEFTKIATIVEDNKKETKKHQAEKKELGLVIDRIYSHFI